MRVTPNTGASLQLRSAVTSRRAWALVGMTSMSLPRYLYLMNGLYRTHHWVAGTVGASLFHCL